MSASRNADSITTAQGEVSSRVPRSKPMMTSGHKPGVQVGNDAVPEFHAETLPAGTAPASNKFTPNPISETPGQALNDSTLRSHGKESIYTSADSTLGGATSGDVHTGLGKPVQGQTASEKKGMGGNDGRGGLAGVGAESAHVGLAGVDERVESSQRGLERETGDLAAGKKDTAEERGGVEDKPNVVAEELAAELP
ncbi:MAG: hypothetical protein MMC33_002907 [Icmadophila ericetorum]|nr:hypothetical protein [Icmadophila ericetorum]